MSWAVERIHDESYLEGQDSARAEWEQRRIDAIADLRQGIKRAVHLAHLYKLETGPDDERIPPLLLQVRRWRIRRDCYRRFSWVDR